MRVRVVILFGLAQSNEYDQIKCCIPLYSQIRLMVPQFCPPKNGTINRHILLIEHYKLGLTKTLIINRIDPLSG